MEPIDFEGKIKSFTLCTLQIFSLHKHCVYFSVVLQMQILQRIIVNYGSLNFDQSTTNLLQNLLTFVVDETWNRTRDSHKHNTAGSRHIQPQKVPPQKYYNLQYITICSRKIKTTRFLFNFVVVSQYIFAVHAGWNFFKFNS